SSRTGTRLYQPPEAAIGREASPQGDVYALGVLLYQMLVGNFQQPLGVGWDREYDAVARRAVDNSPPDERQKVADVWDLLRTDIRDTVDANVAYRLQAADEVAQRLAGLRERQAAVQNERERKRRAEQERLDQQIAEAAHAKVLEERRRSAARYRTLRRWVVGAGVLVVAFGGLAGVSYVQWQRAQANETAANAARADADAKRIAADQSAKEAKRQEDLAIAARKTAEEASADARRQAQLAKEASEIATANAARADDNAKLADQQRNVALDTLHQLVFDVQDQLEERPALHDLRRQILNTALAGLDRISQALGAGDSRSDRLTAAAQLKTAEVYLSLGQVARSLELLRSANDTLVHLSRAAPQDVQAQRDLSISYNKLGDVTRQSGDTQAALAFFQQDLAIAQKLAAADPTDAQAQRDLAVSYERFGQIHIQLGDLAKARDYFEKELVIAEARMQADPASAEAKRFTSVVYNFLGDVTLKTGDTQAALAFFQQGLDIRQKLADADPNDAQAQRDLSFSLTQLGSPSERSNDRLAARRYFEDALSIDRRLAEMDPRNVTSQRDLMVSHNLLGGFLQSDGDFAGAAEHFQSGIAVLDKMIAAGQNVEQSEKSRLSLQQKLQLCQVLEIAVGDWEALLKLPAESVALLLPARCTWLAKKQRTADVAQAAAHLQSLEPVTADNLYNAACGFGLCLKLVSGWDGRSDFPPKEGIPEGTPEEQAARQEYRAKALAAFQAAVAQGYDKFDDARKDADLAALHGDAEFQGLLKPTAAK
ncbi:MAG: tetratricopeptide repeat protein, partial [Planctomycetaceae bacterium]|nr:tetratricopeptide repeat protein [Planctomycetaceae bacterium]